VENLLLFLGIIESVTVQDEFVKSSLGDWSDGGTPGNIPNPVVKSVSADGTWRATSWESRSLPRDSTPARNGGSSLLNMFSELKRRFHAT
jgi:hypothetical protein